MVKLRHDYSIAPWNILFCLYSLLWWLVLSDQAGPWESFWTLLHLHSQLPFKFLLSIQRALDLPPCVHSHRPIQQETEQREITVEERKIELGSPSLSSKSFCKPPQPNLVSSSPLTALTAVSGSLTLRDWLVAMFLRAVFGEILSLKRNTNLISSGYSLGNT